MKSLKLIADSGGTKTDWCFVNEDGEKNYFTTESYHPSFMNHYDIVEQKLKWLHYSSILNLQLFFYGAGCLKTENQQKMISFFKNIGFRNVHVQSDIYAAGIALNDGNGWCAICGTGSVAFKMIKDKIVKIQGGLGREMGDEGSGYYFGKLVVERIASGQLRMMDYPELRSIELIPENYAEIPKLISKYVDDEQIREIHATNILEFAKSYLNGCDEISFCGSYAYYHQSIFREVLSELKIKVHTFLERPIENLVENKLLAV